MRHPHGTCVKFRSWGGPREGAQKPTDYVDFVWELPHKQKVGADGKPVFDEKGHPVMEGYAPDTWAQLGTGTASVTNGDQDTYALIAEYGLFCLDTGKCNMVFFVGEGLKTFVRAWGWNISAGYTNASVSSNGEHSGVGGIGAGFAYAKTGRLADPDGCKVISFTTLRLNPSSKTACVEDRQGQRGRRITRLPPG